MQNYKQTIGKDTFIYKNNGDDTYKVLLKGNTFCGKHNLEIEDMNICSIKRVPCIKCHFENVLPIGTSSISKKNIFIIEYKTLKHVREITKCFGSRDCINIYSDNEGNKWVLKIDKTKPGRFWTESYLGTIYYYFSQKYFPKCAFVFDNGKYIGSASMFNETFIDAGEYHYGSYSFTDDQYIVEKNGKKLLHNSGLGLIIILMFLFGEYDTDSLFNEDSNIGLVKNEKGEYIYYKIDNQLTVFEGNYKVSNLYSLCELDKISRDPGEILFIDLQKLKYVPDDIEVGSSFEDFYFLFTPDYYDEIREAIKQLKQFDLEDFRKFLGDLKNLYDPISGMKNHEVKEYKEDTFNCESNKALTMNRDTIDAVLFNSFYKIHQLEIL